MNRRKKTGDRIGPWGTPLLIDPSTATAMGHSERQLRMSLQSKEGKTQEARLEMRLMPDPVRGFARNNRLVSLRYAYCSVITQVVRFWLEHFFFIALGHFLFLCSHVFKLLSIIFNLLFVMKTVRHNHMCLRKAIRAYIRTLKKKYPVRNVEVLTLAS